MKIKTFEFNPLAVNTYVLSDETGECVIIDAACFYPDEKRILIDYIIDNDLVVKHLINTHLHFDHLFGVNTIIDQFEVQMEANENDAFLLRDMAQQMKLFGFGATNETAPVIKKQLNGGDTILFGNQKLIVLAVPGHSPGSLAFYSEKGGCVFSGDTLFNSSIGRTDLPGGNFSQLIGSIREKLFTLPSDTIVYPGHGPATTIGNEKKFNPFMNQL